MGGFMGVLIWFVVSQGLESPHWYCSRYWPFQKKQKTLYITAEESAIQIKQRAKRLTTDISSDLFISAITEMESIVNMIKKEKPTIVVLDSIQMVMSHKLTSMPGALNQVRLCASMFIKAIKDIGAVGILVGHITKDGQLGRPKDARAYGGCYFVL